MNTPENQNKWYELSTQKEKEARADSNNKVILIGASSA